MQKIIQDVLIAEADAIRGIPAANPFVECVGLFLESRRKGGALLRRVDGGDQGRGRSADQAPPVKADPAEGDQQRISVLRQLIDICDWMTERGFDAAEAAGATIKLQ